MRSWLVATLVVAACSHKQPAMSDEARARDFVAHLAKHDFAGAEAAFDDRVKAALPADKLEAVWAQIEGQFGAFRSIDKVEASGHVVRAFAAFAKASLVLTISIDDDGRIGGFHVAPGDTAKSWTPPPYANPAAFEERDVKVGDLPGTLTVPKGASKVPVLVLVHGSGPNDRDETIGALKPFKDLAQGLASKGVAVLRYDKRTRVHPTGVRTQTEEVDEAAHAAVALARTLPEADPERVALLGHSQGGYLAPRIAKADPAIKRLVILAGSTRPLEDSMLAQVKYLSQFDPTTKQAIPEVEAFKAAVEDPKLAPDAAVKVPFDGSILGSYFLEVRDYHPAEIAAQLTIPLLVLQGERDYQVTVADDFAAWKTALAGHANATLRTYPGLNHAFTHGEGPPSPADYQQPGHVDEHVIDDIAAFLNAR